MTRFLSSQLAGDWRFTRIHGDDIIPSISRVGGQTYLGPKDLVLRAICELPTAVPCQRSPGKLPNITFRREEKC